MAEHSALILRLTADLEIRLHAAAAERGCSSEILAAECIAQSLEVAVRHRVLLERQEQVDQAIFELARAVGEFSAPAAAIDLTAVCRYRCDPGSGRGLPPGGPTAS
jgi:hypothetical protein